MNFPVFVKDDSFSMNKTGSKSGSNTKPRFYIRVACANGKIAFCKITSKNKKFDTGNYLRLPMNNLTMKDSKKNMFKNGSFVDKTLFTTVDGKYINDVKESDYLDLEFDKKSSKIIFDFLMESDKNLERFKKFCKDNSLKMIDFDIKMK